MAAVVYNQNRRAYGFKEAVQVGNKPALYSYGEVQQHRQGEIIQQLKLPRSSVNQNADEIAKAVVKAMAAQQLQ